MEANMAAEALSYWQGINDFESRQAAELREGMFRITDSGGNDLVPGLINQHDQRAQTAAAQIKVLEQSAVVKQEAAPWEKFKNLSPPTWPETPVPTSE
jgi:hypothetical protein